MRVHFYNVGKRKNSTWVPPDSSAVVTRTGALRSPSSISSPTLSVQYNDASGNPTDLNYCYIEEFKRYYFVKDWTFDEGLWVCSLECDVMASFKKEIGEKEYYILRASTKNNGNIIDTLYSCYPVPKRQITKSETTLFPEFDSSKTKGSFVVGISGAGGLTSYYAFEATEFFKFSKKVFSSLDWVQSGNIADLGDDLLKLLFNPTQYITSVLWYPFDLGVNEGWQISKQIQIGWWTIDGLVAFIVPNNPVVLKQTSVKAPPHPQADTRGDYLNSSPYRRMKIHIQGFGTGDIDASKVRSDFISIKVLVELGTGSATAYVLDGESNYLLMNTAGKVGFSIPINEISSNMGDTMVSGATAMVSAGAGRTASAISNTIDFMTQLFQGDVNNLTTASSSCSLFFGTYLYTVHHELVDDDNADNGRPLCENHTLTELGNGFYLVENGNVNIIGAYSDEIEKIKNYLEGGFYYS